jgi:membrane protease YdiL (CAAX protease family)
VLDRAPESQALEPQPAPVEARPAILPVQRLGAFVEVLLCSGYPSQLFLIAVLTGFGMPLRTAAGDLSPQFVFTLSMLDTVFVIGLVLFFLKAHRESPRQVLLGDRPAVREAFLGATLIPVIFLWVLVILALILILAPQLHNVPKNPLEDMIQNRRDALIFAIVVTVAGGVREEVQRGFILHRFSQYLGGGAAGIVVFSVVFGLGHIDQGIDAAIVTGLLGAAWGVIYLARRSIIAPMVSHAGFNLLQLVKYLGLG